MSSFGGCEVQMQTNSKPYWNMPGSCAERIQNAFKIKPEFKHFEFLASDAVKMFHLRECSLQLGSIPPGCLEMFGNHQVGSFQHGDHSQSKTSTCDVDVVSPQQHTLQFKLEGVRPASSDAATLGKCASVS